MTSQTVCVGSIVHLVVDDRGRRCCAAIVTATADPTDAYRDTETIGVRVWTDTDTIIRSLPDGGVGYDPGHQPKNLAWSCDGLDHAIWTWHHPAMIIRGIG